MPEREAKLVIAAARPEVVADAIAALRRLGDHALIPASTLSIRDIYLDTTAGALRARRHSLRIRQEDSRTLVTLKGPGREVEAGVVERDELEIAWSAEAYTRSLVLLAERGIALPRVAFGADAVATLLASGLVRIQERETRRRRRHAEDAGSLPLAELAIDEVTYRATGGPVRHHEVEIEAKAPAGADYLPRAVEDLRARFGAALAPWGYGKLATGLAVERLLASPDGAGMVIDGHLAPAAYPRLAALLSAEGDGPAD